MSDSRLHHIIEDALDEADNRWQHGIATAPEEWAGRMADAIEAALIEATGGVEHIVQVKKGRWTIRHPLIERFERYDEGTINLFTCDYVRLVAIAAGQGAFGEGMHHVWLDRGALMWEEVI